MRLQALKGSILAFLMAILVIGCQSEQETQEAKPGLETKPESM